MENSFYLYSDYKLKIERLHLCTWDVRPNITYIEIGAEFVNDSESLLPDKFDFDVQLPFSLGEAKARSLHSSLIQEKYSRYIFNDIISSSTVLEEDAQRGKVLHFKERKELAILPSQCTFLQDGHIKIFIDKNGAACNVYVRIIIELPFDTIATSMTGISKRSYIYDFKINEKRNMPEDLVTKIKSADLLPIKQVFLFHVIPDRYSIDFYDSNKFRSVRKLEGDVFSGYTGITELNDNHYIILFNKESARESYSFYTCFSDEIIGTKQVILAIGANIICSLLFALPGIRISWNENLSWFSQFPWEWMGALLILLVLFVYIKKK